MEFKIHRPSIYSSDNIYSTIFQELITIINNWIRLNNEELSKKQTNLYLLYFVVLYLKKALSSNDLMDPNELILSDSYKLTFILMIDLLYFEKGEKPKNEDINYFFPLPREFQLIFQILCLTSVESISTYFSVRILINNF